MSDLAAVRQALEAEPRLRNLARIYRSAMRSDDGQRCMVAPAPRVRQEIDQALDRIKEGGFRLAPGHSLRLGPPNRLGLNDGVIIPGARFPLGTSPSRIRAAAAERAPLRGAVQVIVVLVEFSDRKMETSRERLEELFFSESTLETGSVRDYFRDVTGELIDIQGQVVGPYELPEPLEAYAGGESGMQAGAPNAQTMARHAAEAADKDVDFGPYDNDKNGLVDAFVVVHAGLDGAATNKGSDIWSHKWVLVPEAYQADAAEIFAYLTIPEDAELGVCAHELGHLVFGWPDLYDTDYSSNGLGDWCLMASGSWTGDPQGTRPVHPSAWCKAHQKWVEVVNVRGQQAAQIPDVKQARKVWRLWGETGGQEYFLAENRARTGFDEHLPGEGLLVWHIDDSTESNSNENHYKVALVQADGLRGLETRGDSGDPGDPFPGSSDKRAFDGQSVPNSNSYSGVSSEVSITDISDPGPEMSARLTGGDG
jgi:immune inhibitor A